MKFTNEELQKIFLELRATQVALGKVFTHGEVVEILIDHYGMSAYQLEGLKIEEWI